jgi:hypothetical protein
MRKFSPHMIAIVQESSLGLAAAVKNKQNKTIIINIFRHFFQN